MGSRLDFCPYRIIKLLNIAFFANLQALTWRD